MVVTLPIISTGSNQPADLPGQAVSLREANEIVVRAVAQTLVIIIHHHKLTLPLPWNYSNSSGPQKHKAGENQSLVVSKL